MSLTRRPRTRPATAARAPVAAVGLLLVVGACGGEDQSTDPGTGDGFTVVLPDAPDGEHDGSVDRVPGVVLEPDRVNGDIQVWCDDLTLNPRDDAPNESGVFAFQGEFADPFEGAAWSIEFSAEQFEAGDIIELPSPAWDLVFFYLAAVPETAPVVWELSSSEEESFGTIILHEIPCRGDGDTLRFSIDGGIGSERNPGYIAWGDATGGVSGRVGEPPPGFAG